MGKALPRSSHQQNDDDGQSAMRAEYLPKTSRSRPRNSPILRRSAVCGYMAFRGLEHIPDLNHEDFTDVRWRTIARAAVNVHNAGKVANHLSINDEIEARGWDKALAKEFLVGNWKDWRDIADASLALSRDGTSIRECIKDLRYYAQKRREQEIFKRAVNGELTGEQAVEALIKNRPSPVEANVCRPCDDHQFRASA